MISTSDTRRSKELIEGRVRAAHRALLYAIGLTKKDLSKPLIAIVNSWNEIVPGHIHLQTLSESVKKGVRDGGGVPLEFNTIAICDGLCQGHIGMSYPLPSRDLIADSIELMVEAHRFDAMVLITDNPPGAAGTSIQQLAEQRGARPAQTAIDRL